MIAQSESERWVTADYVCRSRSTATPCRIHNSAAGATARPSYPMDIAVPPGYALAGQYQSMPTFTLPPRNEAWIATCCYC
jgi:hypothetical protein